MTNKYKIYALALISLLFLTLDWWLIRTALYNGQPLEFWLWAVLASLVWISSFSFLVLTNYEKRIFTGHNLLGLVAYLVIFPKGLFVFLGGIIFFLLLYLFQNRLKALEKNQSHFSLRRLVGDSIIILTYGFLLLLGFNIYYNTSQDFKANPDLFYERLGESAAQSFRLSQRVPSEEFSLNQSLDEFLIKQAAEQNQQNFDLAATREQFLRRFGIAATGEERLSDIFARAVVDRVRESARNYQALFPLIFTLIILALLRTFAFIFNWLGIFVSWLMFKLLLALKFFRITKVTVEVDKLEI